MVSSLCSPKTLFLRLSSTRPKSITRSVTDEMLSGQGCGIRTASSRRNGLPSGRSVESLQSFIHIIKNCKSLHRMYRLLAHESLLQELEFVKYKLLTKSFVQSRLSDQPARWLRNNLPFQENRSSTYHGPPYPPAQCFANIRTMPV